MVTDEMVKRAATEYLSHKGERPYRVTRRGAELWEDHAPALRAALEAALSAAEPVGWQWRHPRATGGEWMNCPNGPRADKLSQAEYRPVYAAPPAPFVGVKALEWQGIEASAATGHYRVQRLDDKWEPLHNGHYMLPKVYGVVKAFDTQDEAKAHCQQYHEARILSALSAQVQHVAGSIIKLGVYGRAYDRPEERRAYTYEHQPGNIEAHKLGRACSDVRSGGDWIDRGLNLLNSLQREGYGVFELPAAPEKQDGEPYEERLLDRCRFESGSLTEARWPVPAIAASKPAGDARFSAAAPAKQEANHVTSQ